MTNIPNWCSGVVNIKGRPKDIEKFCKLFIHEGQEGKKKLPYFCRSFNQNTDWKSFKKNHLGKSEAEFMIDFAWSVHSCLIEGYPQEKKGSYTLQKACKKYKVDVEIESEESGMGFEEKVICNSKGKLSEECFDMPTYKCKKCGCKQMFPSAYDETDLEDQECPDCNKNKWRLVK